MIVAPMFRLLGESSRSWYWHLSWPAIVTRRRFDPEATLDPDRRHHATGLVGGAGDVRSSDYRPRFETATTAGHLRFATASGSQDADPIIVIIHGPIRRRDHRNNYKRDRGRDSRLPTGGPAVAPRRRSARRNRNRILDSSSPRCPPARSSIYTSQRRRIPMASQIGAAKDFHAGFKCHRATSTATSARTTGCSSSGAAG